MIGKREFMTRLVLERGVHPDAALVTWKELNDACAGDWELDISAPGPFLQGVWDALDATSEGTRRTFFALLRERYNEKTGERR